MSDQDEALLDEDLGDEEYDLGNDEEEALLADDYEIDRQNSYKGEEETDDVLDLGVTDALDDLEGEDENIEYRSDTDNHNHNDFYKEERTVNHGGYYDQEEHEDIREEHYEDGVMQSDSALQNSLNTVDLREKLQKNVQRKVFVGNGQGLEDDDCDEAEERRNRFQNERIMIPQKMNHEIPDSLENVVTVEQVRQQPSFRGHGRGRGMRGIRGGRFAVPNPQGNFIPRFNHNIRGQPMFNEQKSFRPPLLEGRPPMYPRAPSNNMMNQQQQLMYQQNPPQLSPYMSNGPPQPPGPHFAEPRPPFNPNQFPGPGMSQGPRMIGGGPRLEYRPRGSMPGPAMPRYNCPPGVPPYMQNQSQHFQPPMIPGNQGPSLLGNPNLPLPGNQGPPGLHGNPGGPQIPLNQGPPMQDNPVNVMMQNFSRIPGPNQGPSGPNQSQIPNEVPFNNRPNFQGPSFEGRPMYDPRPMYNNQPPPPQPVSQMNNSALVSPPQQAGPHVPNVPLPPGHKILINPHFRGAVQPTADARLAWDSQQQQQPPQHQQPPHQPPQHQLPQHQPPQHPPVSGDGFAQAPSSYQNQNPYGPPAAPPPQQQQGSQDYQQNYQSVKSDDPYAYFSDVWQENKAQKSSPTNKSYPPENNYSRDSYSNYGSKYSKSESTWDRDSYQEEQRGSSQNYRERDPPPRPRIDNVQRQRVSVSNNSYHNEPYDQKPSSRPMATSARPAARPLIKRSPESHERVQRPLSPKRVKIMSNRYESRTTSSNENVNTKKEEDMDPEMKEYRKKMEEQKRLREKILQEKENRRKQAAMAKMGDESRVDSRNEGTQQQQQQQQETKPVSVVTGVTKDNAHPMPARGRSRPANAQATEGPERAPGVRIVRAIQTVENQPAKEAIAPIASVQNNERGRPLTGQTVARRVVIHKPLLNTQKIATTVQKTVSNLQRTQANARITQNVPKGILKKQAAATGQKVIVNANRTIVQELPGQLRVNVKDVTKTNVQKVVVNTQNNQRVVLQKATGQIKPRPAETKTNTVRIENLAASTSESQIRRMCQGIGTLESIHMGEGNATIVFKTQSAALVFHKKYQRKMLDLSLINVHLVQPTSNN